MRVLRRRSALCGVGRVVDYDDYDCDDDDELTDWGRRQLYESQAPAGDHIGSRRRSRSIGKH